MSHVITPHEPAEELVSSVEEVFREAEESEKRWQEWEQKHQRRAILIELPQSEYIVLENLAQQQGKTVPQLVQTLLDSILSTLLPSLQVATDSEQV